MKYKDLYAVLNKRRSMVAGFSYEDRSGWHVAKPDYIDRTRPLWIIAEDRVARKRIWIAQEGVGMGITVRAMDGDGQNCETLRRINCRSRKKLAELLQGVFEQIDRHENRPAS